MASSAIAFVALLQGGYRAYNEAFNLDN